MEKESSGSHTHNSNAACDSFNTIQATTQCRSLVQSTNLEYEAHQVRLAGELFIFLLLELVALQRVATLDTTY